MAETEKTAETAETTEAEKVETPEEKKARRRAERKKRISKPIAIPDPAKFDGPAKEQLVSILEASKAFVDAVKSANEVIPQALTSIRRGVNQALVIYVRNVRKDPVEKRRAKLEAQILRAQEKLEELLKETE